MKFGRVLVLILLVTLPVHASDWPQLRGPFFNGSTDETNLPAQWSRTKSVVWSADLPGPSAATPIVFGDRVFVSSTDKSNDVLKAMCFDRKSGDLLWQRTVAKGIRRDRRSTFAAPTPATDGNIVVFFYGNGDLIAYDFAGNQQWKQNIGPFAFGWTFSTSPVIYDGTLYLQVLQGDVAVHGEGKPRNNESFLLALNPGTGKTKWRTVRPSEAVAESLEAFTTPMPYVSGGRRELLVAGGDALTGHDLKSGRELWRWETWNPQKIGHWRLVPSPVAGDGVILVCAPKSDPIYAVPAGKSGRLSDRDLLWVSRDQRDISSDVPTPSFYDGDFFILSDVRKSLSRVDPKTGAIKWTVKTPGRKKYEASPLAADGKIYTINFDGTVAVFDANSGKQLSVIPMETELGEDFVRASMVAAHGQLFIRTNSELYCVGKGEG